MCLVSGNSPQFYLSSLRSIENMGFPNFICLYLSSLRSIGNFHILANICFPSFSDAIWSLGIPKFLGKNKCFRGKPLIFGIALQFFSSEFHQKYLMADQLAKTKTSPEDRHHHQLHHSDNYGNTVAVAVNTKSIDA